MEAVKYKISAYDLYRGDRGGGTDDRGLSSRYESHSLNLPQFMSYYVKLPLHQLLPSSSVKFFSLYILMKLNRKMKLNKNCLSTLFAEPYFVQW